MGDITQTTEIHQMVIETARLLLEAGSHTKNSNQTFSQSILEDLDLLTNPCAYTSHLESWLHCAHCNLFPLFAQLVELLLTYEEKTTAKLSLGKKEILSAVGDFVTCPEALSQLSINSCNSILDSLAGMYRGAMLSGVYENFSVLWIDKCVIDKDQFATEFTYLAGYSSLAGRSQRMMQILLNDMSAKEVNDIKKLLILRQKDFTMSTTTKELRTFTMEALTFLEKVEPRRLQHLARSIIVGAMSYKSLCNLTYECIPPHLHEYVQMYKCAY